MLYRSPMGADDALIGRETELAAVAGFLAGGVADGLVLHGEAGLGKAALWQAALWQAAGRSAVELGALTLVAPRGEGRVTIDGNDSPFGAVTSSRRVCKADVKVVVLEVVGTRGGGDDRKVGSDSTSLQGSTWSWSIGNPGLDDGARVYAKVRAHDGCRSALSPTMVVDRG